MQPDLALHNYPTRTAETKPKNSEIISKKAQRNCAKTRGFSYNRRTRNRFGKTRGNLDQIDKIEADISNRREVLHDIFLSFCRSRDCRRFKEMTLEVPTSLARIVRHTRIYPVKAINHLAKQMECRRQRM